NLGQDGKHVQASEQDRRGDAQFAARRGPLARRGAFDLLEIGEHPTRASQKAHASLGEADRARGAVEKSHTEPRFEFSNRARNGGPRARAPARRRGETAALGNFHKRRNAVDTVHTVAYTAIIYSNEGVLSLRAK